MVTLREKHLEADVLVIGAGGAGLRAAIEAKNIGADILVVSKGKFPTGCVTAVAMGAMLASFDRRDSVDRHFEETLHGGHHLNNPNLVRILVNQAIKRAKDLEQYGTNFDKEGEEYKLFPFTGSSIPRGVLASDPYQGGFIKGLAKEVERLSINILDHVMVIDLIKERNVVVGAVGIELETNTILFINARAVIIATGGAGNLYSLTTNPPGVTGDGYALAYRAGAKLSDMEFIQTRACMIFPEAMRGTPPPGDGLVTLGGRFYNGLCERYMGRYHPDKFELVERAEMAKCTQKEIMEGRHSPHKGVYGDLSGVQKEKLLKFKGFMEACAAENFDPTWQPYEWAPGAHYFMGGIAINGKCETGVEGLYAAGEAAAGTMGANRLAANSLTETQVFGAIAGESAAKRALVVSKIPISQSQIDLIRNRLRDILKRDRGFDVLEVKDQITETMSLYVGDFRNEEGLGKAVETLDKIKRGKSSGLYLGGEQQFKKLAALIEVENLLTVGQMIASAARMRTETRGAHNREDYPESDDANWLKNIVIRSVNDQMKLETRPVPKETGASTA
jgi:fumarate reductase (CoM/CoB) subunit A